ncbi:MAG TPA: plastocyanin/azurin family copper-binding protein [Ilumatobacter sp.]|nr:plastocyanin/azurin family copper-binding protein [Ilumatobacter sp.]
MTPRIRAAAAAVTLSLGAPLALAACGDDANDHALRAQQLADRLAEERASTTVPAPVVTTGSTTLMVEPVETITTVPAVQPTGVVIAVTALDNSFRPASIEAKVGDEVVWENRGRNEHDILSIEGTLDDGTAWGLTVDEFQPGDIFAHMFTEPGEYRYYCTIHGTSEVGMIGTVIVTN